MGCSWDVFLLYSYRKPDAIYGGKTGTIENEQITREISKKETVTSRLIVSANTGEVVYRVNPFVVHDRSHAVFSIAYPPSESELAVGCPDGCFRIVDAESGRILRTTQLGGGGVDGVAYSSCGRLVAAVCRDKRLRTLDSQSMSVLHSTQL